MAVGVITTPRRTIEISKNPPTFLVIDQHASIWRAAYWRIRQPRDGGRWTPNPLSFQTAQQDGAIASGAKMEAWIRRAGQNHSLELLLGELLDGEPHDEKTVAWYIGSTQRA